MTTKKQLKQRNAEAATAVAKPTVSDTIACHQMGHIDVFAGEIVDRRQPRLAHHQHMIALRNRLPAKYRSDLMRKCRNCNAVTFMT